jgi:hypothetical protein
MREKTERYVATFSTTTAALAMEGACRAAGVPGRLIPVPRSISAGCGMCWSAPREAAAAVEELIVGEHLEVDGLYVILL